MDSINISNFKIKKAKAIKKHRQIQKIAGLFRIVELGIVVALVSQFFIRVPVSFKSCCEYLKGLTLVLASPCFIFVLGNAIVITLFANSGQYAVQDSKATSARVDVYQEFMEKSEKRQVVNSSVEENNVRIKQTNHVRYIKTEDKNPVSSENKNYQRSQSEKIKRQTCNKKSCSELKRSASTDTCLEIVASYQTGSEKSLYSEENMSNEEFRCTIEAFIKKQKKFRIDEENSMF